MTGNGWIQIALFSLIVIAVTRPLGGYMTRVFAGEWTFLWPVLRPVERAVYWCCGVDENEEQHWLTYAVAILFFSVAGFGSLYALQRLQWYLPFNPQGQTGVAPDLAFNTSVSFVTNTNWQAYGGETTMGYLVQMAGLTVHNFVSAATGIAMALALIRGFVRREAKTIGNFWVDLTRCTLYILLPIALASRRTKPRISANAMAMPVAAETKLCTVSPAIWPNVCVMAAPITMIASISIRFVNGVGFSYGCAALALKKPPPLVPRFLMISCEATGPCAITCFAPSSVVAST